MKNKSLIILIMIIILSAMLLFLTGCAEENTTGNNVMPMNNEQNVAQEERLSEENKEEEQQKILEKVNKIDATKDIVYTGDEYTKDEYANVLDKTLHYTYKYPVININSADVQTINSEIKLKYGFTDETKEELPFYEIEVLTYEYYINGNILSVIPIMGGNDSTSTAIYNIDLTTGNKVNNADLLNNKNIDLDIARTKLREFALNKMDMEVERLKRQYPSNSSNFEEVAKEYKERFNETLENALKSFDNVYLNADGDVCIRIDFETLGGQEYCNKEAEINVSKMSDAVKVTYMTYLDPNVIENLKDIRSEW